MTVADLRDESHGQIFGTGDRKILSGGGAAHLGSVEVRKQSPSQRILQNPFPRVILAQVLNPHLYF